MSAAETEIAPEVTPDVTPEVEPDAPPADNLATPNAPAAPGAPSSAWADLRGTLPEVLRDNPALANFESLEGLASEHVELQRLIGGEKIARPTADSPPEDWARFYKALGRPDEASGYDFGEFAPPENVPWDQGLMDSLVERLHGRGLTNEQMKGALGDYAELISEQHAAALAVNEEAFTAASEALQTEWGLEFDAKHAQAKGAWQRFFGDQAESIGNLQLADGTLLGTNPVMVKTFAEIGAAMGEHGFHGPTHTPGGFSPESALSQIEELESSPENRAIFADSNHPEFNALSRKRQALYDAAYPESQ